MADTLYTLDVVQNAGQVLVSHPSLFGAKIIYLTREGTGMVQTFGATPFNQREFVFKTSGFFAYRIRFFSVAETQQKIHVIYKL